MFGEYLIKKGLIDQVQLETSLSRQLSYKKPIGEILVELGFLEIGSLDYYLQEFLSNKAEELISDQSLWTVTE
jgi:hypothetical protein